VAGVEVPRTAMSYLGEGRTELAVSADPAADGDTVLMLLGGAPFEEEIVMWWNFIGRSHDEIVEQRAAWNGDGLDHEPERFGVVRGFAGDRLLAPPMPNTRLKPRPRAV
jgi:redox-sensitive bicupin YhaK (pirin superfamily)